MQNYYAARANEYDAIYRKPERQADLREIEHWLPTVFAGRRVLEVACGTGYWTRFIAPASASLTGIDAAPETLRVARSRVPADKVQLLVGDAWHLPFAPAAFDAGFAGFWWSHVPRRRLPEFLRGFHACLAPGARVVFIDNLFVEGSSTPIASRDADGDTWQLRRLADGSTHRVMKNFPTREELLEVVAGLGHEVRHRTWAHYWALEYLTGAG